MGKNVLQYKITANIVSWQL